MSESSTFTASDGDGYELLMGRWSRLLAPRFIDFAGVASGARVLDVGCGTGNLALCLAENPDIGLVTGVDFSPVYIDHARRRSSDPRITFDVGDACALPFEDASFDHSLSMLVLQFIPEAATAVGEMRRVTRPGGTVAAATWDARGGYVSFRLFFDTAAVIDPGAVARRAKAYTRPMSRPGELERAWRAAGLVDIVQDMASIRMDFASFADFWAPIDGRDGPLADYVSSLGSDVKRQVRDAVERAYLDGEPDGSRSFMATAWVVKGTVPD
jgi:SAM-dependent methyltransferase